MFISKPILKAVALFRTTGVSALALLSPAIAGSAWAQTYNVTDLGPNVMPRAVNDKGQVACDNPAALTLWSGGRTIVLKSGTGFKKAESINSTGQIVGTYDTGVIGADGYSIIHAFLWTPTVANGERGTFIDLNETLPIDSGWVLNFAHDINDAGQIVGDGTFTDALGTSQRGRNYLWQRDADGYGKLTSVPMGPSNNENPSALNNLASPQVAGSINTASFVWQADTSAIPVGHLDFANTQAFSINDAGQVVGISSNKAFLWTPGGTDGVLSNPQMKNLQPTTGVQPSKAFDINNAGLVVGLGIYSANSSYFGFSWDNTNGWRDLNKVSTKPANWQLQTARGCNNRRSATGAASAQIVASGYIGITTTSGAGKKRTTTTKNEPHGFLLTPQ